MSRRSKALRYYRRSRMRPGAGRYITGLLKFLLVFFLLYLFVTSFVISTYRMETESMKPTLPAGERLLGSPLPYGFKIPLANRMIPGFTAPKRGDIVAAFPERINYLPLYRVLLDPPVRFFTLQRITLLKDGRSPWLNDFHVKRIIGIPGDTVKMEGSFFFIQPEGRNVFFHEKDLIQRRYDIIPALLPEGWPSDYPYSGYSDPVTLGPEEYYLSGDNRAVSHDSRDFGPVNKNRLKSRLFFSYQPRFAFR